MGGQILTDFTVVRKERKVRSYQSSKLLWLQTEATDRGTRNRKETLDRVIISIFSYEYYNYGMHESDFFWVKKKQFRRLRCSVFYFVRHRMTIIVWPAPLNDWNRLSNHYKERERSIKKVSLPEGTTFVENNFLSFKSRVPLCHPDYSEMVSI